MKYPSYINKEHAKKVTNELRSLFPHLTKNQRKDIFIQMHSTEGINGVEAPKGELSKHKVFGASNLLFINIHNLYYVKSLAFQKSVLVVRQSVTIDTEETNKLVRYFGSSAISTYNRVDIYGDKKSLLDIFQFNNSLPLAVQFAHKAKGVYFQLLHGKPVNGYYCFTEPHNTDRFEYTELQSPI